MAYLSNLTTIAQATASGSAGGGDLFGALGIDWKLLIIQGLAFLVLVFVLGKYVYPILIKSIDKRQDQLDAGAKAAAEAQRQAREAEDRIAAQLKDARKEADDIVATAHKEAGDMVAAAETRATTRAEHIVNEAKAGIESDIIAARAALQRETRQLVAEATEKIIGEKLDGARDNALIDKALKSEGKA